MTRSEPTSSRKIQNLLQRIETHRARQQDQSLLETDSSQFFSGSGLTYQTHEGPLTVLCMVEGEVCYFQGGMVYVVNHKDFARLQPGGSRAGVRPEIVGDRGAQLSEVEVEFVLGVVSALDPMACWTIIGNDLLRFVKKYRSRIDRWTMQIASLLLAQKILRKYVNRLYQIVSATLMDGTWSTLSASVATDDAAIARFCGRLLGAHGSEEALEHLIRSRWKVLEGLLRGLEAAAGEGAEGQIDPVGQGSHAGHLTAAFRKLGLRVTGGEFQQFLADIDRHREEIRNSIGIIRSAFEERRASVRADSTPPSRNRSARGGQSGTGCSFVPVVRPPARFTMGGSERTASSAGSCGPRGLGFPRP